MPNGWMERVNEFNLAAEIFNYNDGVIPYHSLLEDGEWATSMGETLVFQ